ncbi:HET-domain-containing protein [Xylariaceae sp. FL0255]|nr:HET-domain-containing protein [Xylariaceae sp. FL0255]
MWLLNTTSVRLEFSELPPKKFAILSHTWGDEEVLFHELQDNAESVKKKKGWDKITKFCEEACKRGFACGWVDTCCIDKRSSAELTEAINSMYSYYYSADACFIYLGDVPAPTAMTYSGGPNISGYPPAIQRIMKRDDYNPSKEAQMRSVRKTRWLTRGWTLQELIAPAKRLFFASDWSEIDDEYGLGKTISEVTNIPQHLLQNRNALRLYSTAERFSWAAKRVTKRPEDRAYSLMGLFNVSLPILYGEGEVSAFRRLQLEIMQTSSDMSIFAWRGDYEFNGMLAREPADFARSKSLSMGRVMDLSPYSMTNVGLSIRLKIINAKSLIKRGILSETGIASHDLFLAATQCEIIVEDQPHSPMIYLDHLPGQASFTINGKRVKAFRRVKCKDWALVPLKELHRLSYEEVLIVDREQALFLWDREWWKGRAPS